MTAEKKFSSVTYLTSEFVKKVHYVIAKRFESIGEPIPPLLNYHDHEIENLVLIPQQTFDGVELYPSLESKATILFYKVNKSQIFPNGNKRLSLALLLVFLRINGYRLAITENEATQKALELANSKAEDFEKLKIELENWIKANLEDIT